MDIRKAMQELNELEREKAQLELLSKQLGDQRVENKKQMDDLGVTPETIDDKIVELEKEISEQLAIAKGEKKPVVDAPKDVAVETPAAGTVETEDEDTLFIPDNAESAAELLEM